MEDVEKEDMEKEVHELITSSVDEVCGYLLRLYGKCGSAPSEGALLDQKEEELVDAVLEWLEAVPPASSQERQDNRERR